jgi:hypothetical protein
MAIMRERAVQVLLVLMAVGNLVVGLWAQFAPRSFYDDFPGGGRHWVSADGPYNEHLVRDVGGLNLGLAVVVLAAVFLGTVAVARIAAIASLVFAVPHLTYHASHLDLYDTGDQVANMVSLGLTVIAPVAVLALLAGQAYRTPNGAIRAGASGTTTASEATRSLGRTNR